MKKEKEEKELTGQELLDVIYFHITNALRYDGLTYLNCSLVLEVGWASFMDNLYVVRLGTKNIAYYAVKKFSFVNNKEIFSIFDDTTACFSIKFVEMLAQKLKAESNIDFDICLTDYKYIREVYLHFTKNAIWFVDHINIEKLDNDMVLLKFQPFDSNADSRAAYIFKDIAYCWNSRASKPSDIGGVLASNDVKRSDSFLEEGICKNYTYEEANQITAGKITEKEYLKYNVL